MAQVHAHIVEMERDIFGGPSPSELQARRNVELAEQNVRLMLTEHHGGSMPFDRRVWLHDAN